MKITENIGKYLFEAFFLWKPDTRSLEFYSEDVMNLKTEIVPHPGEILSREIA